MIACMSTQNSELENQEIRMMKSPNQGDQKRDFDQSNNNQSSPKLVPSTNQKQFEKRTFPYFRYEDGKRLNQLRRIIQSAQKDKPIRLYLENVPSFANEFDFDERCRGLLNVVWNYKKQNSCFILIENKEYALDILELENDIPPYCKEGRIFVTRAEENSILYAKKPSPKRFESYYNLSGDLGFFIVESNKMKYFWYDQKGGFYDEYGIYYNQQGRPSPPPYINQNNRAINSRKNHRATHEKNNNNNNNNNGINNNNNYNNNKRSSQNPEQKNSSPKLSGLKPQSNNQVEYIKKSDLEIIQQKNNQSQNQNGENNQSYKPQQQQSLGNNDNQQNQDNGTKNNRYKNRQKSSSSGSFNSKGNIKSINNNNTNNKNNSNDYQNGNGNNSDFNQNLGRNEIEFQNGNGYQSNENQRKGNNYNQGSKNSNGDERTQSNSFSQQNGDNTQVKNNNNFNNQNGGFKNKKKSNSVASQHS